ncbi:putative membrane protein YccC [Neolewinella xylanilytica]|uniref:Putative membrane protein YccC n=1 Tax=Neolewinella xylanilytica TaxID=1514080 RepID=A0A2S6I7X7_9BACT|nr:FUSC family protein [Neolewinella xylanilytica]PPK87588.1 putative membrane protein YccC [Neolewinella xylanilytica]
MPKIPLFEQLGKRSTALLKDHAFGRGILMVLAIVVAIVVVSHFFPLSTAVSTALGIFLVSICDLPGNRAAHVANQVVGLLLAVTNVVLIQFTLDIPYLNLLVLPALAFASAYLSVLGKRASLVSFSGLLALVLAYAFPQTGWQILRTALAIAAGGVWFILLNLLFHPLRYRQYRIGLLNDLLRLTANYLALKGAQLRSDTTDEQWPPLIRVHNQISENRKELADYFYATNPDSVARRGESHEGVLFIELVELIELAAAVPLRRAVGRRSAAVLSVADILDEVKDALICVADKSSNFRTAQPEQLRRRLLSLVPEADEEPTDDRNEFHHYLGILIANIDRQLDKLENIQALGEREMQADALVFEPDAYERLRPKINWRGLQDSFTTEDAVFRHSLRLAAVVTLGYLVGQVLGVQNAYWIMLTVVVILRPSYVQSKDRSLERTIGTLIGAALAASVVFLTDSYLVYGIIAAVALPFMFVYLNKDYRIAALFVTLNLVFVYAMLHPSAYTVIAYRIVDTVIGAVLAWLASRFLWPAWERGGITALLGSALLNIRAYLQQESALFRAGKSDGLEYRLARREAFVSLGELDATYERVLREPGGGARQSDRMSDIVTDLHRILSVVAHIGTLLRYTAPSLDQGYVNTLIQELTTELTHCYRLAINESAYVAPPPEAHADELAQFRDARQRETHLTLVLEYEYLRQLTTRLQAHLQSGMSGAVP